MAPLADATRAPAMSSYMRGRFAFLGIPRPALRAAAKPVLKKLRAQSGVDWDFVDACWDADEREYQYVALDYLVAVRGRLSAADVPRLRALAQSKAWWDSIDVLDKVVGDIALRDPSVNDVLRTWARDEDFWLRRSAIDHQRGRKTHTDTELLAEIIEANFGSSEFFINKAIGWALRDYSKTNPDWVGAFVDAHRAEMAPLSVREASKYL
nr:DNA alkylation repair protein [Corynebacterium phoceense]